MKGCLCNTNFVVKVRRCKHIVTKLTTFAKLPLISSSFIRKGEACTPTLSKLGRKYHLDWMYARKWPYPVYALNISTLIDAIKLCVCNVKHILYRDSPPPPPLTENPISPGLKIFVLWPHRISGKLVVVTGKSHFTLTDPTYRQPIPSLLPMCFTAQVVEILRNRISLTCGWPETYVQWLLMFKYWTSRFELSSAVCTYLQ